MYLLQASRPVSVQASGNPCRCCISPTPHIAYHDTVETMHVSLIPILWDNISDPRSNVSDPYYPFGEVYSDASWNHGTVSANPNYTWWPDNQWEWPEYSWLFLPHWRGKRQGKRGEGGVGWSPGGEGWADTLRDQLQLFWGIRPAALVFFGQYKKINL